MTNLKYATADILWHTSHMQSINLKATVSPQLTGLRLDQTLAKLFPQYSRARLQTWIKQGAVTVDGKKIDKKEKVVAGQEIVIAAQIEAEHTWGAEAIPLNIVYEDDDIIIVDKPAGLVVHPGAGNQNKTLVNALLHRYPELANVPRAGVVHRLDKETSGLLMVARTLAAHHNLIKQLQKHTAKREYQALVQGIIISGNTIDAPIDRHPRHRTKMAVVETGKAAITHYRVLEKFPAHTLLKVDLETGRTHQIRVHMAYINHAIIGDPEYGRLKLPANCSATLKAALQSFKRQALHAWKLQLTHPTTQAIMQWEAPLPADMEELLQMLRKDKKDHE